MIGFIARSFTIIRNHNQLQYITVNDCLRLALFWLDYGWLHSGLSLFWSQLSLSLMLRPTARQPVCLGIKHPSGAYDQIFITVRPLRLSWCGALPLMRRRVSFTVAAAPRQRSHSRVRVPWDSRSYFTVSDLRLAFSWSPTTRRAMVEIFNPASTLDWSQMILLPPVI
jgi:hypothetical protein